MIPRDNLEKEPAYCYGRDEILDLVFDELLRTNQPIILKGFGGIGKSTIAKKIAHRCKSTHSFQLIIWLDLRKYNVSQPTDLNSILDVISRVYDPTTPPPSINKLESIRKMLSSVSTLLVFDNFESIINSNGEIVICDFINNLPIAESADFESTVITRAIITTREISKDLENLQPRIHIVSKLDFENAQIFMLEIGKNCDPPITLDKSQQESIYNLSYGIPQLIKVAIGQSEPLPFKDREQKLKYDSPLKESDEVYGYLFYRAWNGILNSDHKLLLTSMTFFVEHAPREALMFVTDISSNEFNKIVRDLHYMSLLEVDFYEANQIAEYRIHPLTQKICESEIEINLPAKENVTKKFVNYYLMFCKQPYDEKNRLKLEREINNIGVAIKLAEQLSMWETLIEFHQPVNRFMWLAGYWKERIEIDQSIIKACHQVGNFVLEAQILVEDIGFTYLRLEELENAENYIRQGLALYQSQDNVKGIALSNRHLGKSALLKAEYERIKPGQHWQEYFEEADTLYTQSLKLREELSHQSADEEIALADLELDFGRLYWLWGRKLERDSRTQKKAKAIHKSFKLYGKSIAASEHGLILFELHTNLRGRSKAMGNLGNVHKQIGLSYLADSDKNSAFSEFDKAREYYENSLGIAQGINKNDEIAHAKWGLAEIYELYVNEWAQTDKIDLALEFARHSNALYSRMATPYDMEVTQALFNRILSKRNEIFPVTEQQIEKRKVQIPMIETMAVPVLMKAVDFLFGEGTKILDERRKRREEKAENKKSNAEDDTSAPSTKNALEDLISTKEMALAQPIRKFIWLESEKEIDHLFSLIDIHRKKYYLAQKQYAIYGDADVPPRVIHQLEESEQGILENTKKLKLILSKVYGKEITIPELD